MTKSKLTPIEKQGKTTTGESLWLCKCDCGNTTIARASNLTSGHTKSCGCLKKKVIVPGQKIELKGSSIIEDDPIEEEVNDASGEETKIETRLTPIKQTGRLKSGEVLWECQCTCGNTRVVRSSLLRSGKTRSCGCLKKEMLRARAEINVLGGNDKIVKVKANITKGDEEIVKANVDVLSRDDKIKQLKKQIRKQGAAFFFKNKPTLKPKLITLITNELNITEEQASNILKEIQ